MRAISLLSKLRSSKIKTPQCRFRDLRGLPRRRKTQPVTRCALKQSWQSWTLVWRIVEAGLPRYLKQQSKIKHLSFETLTVKLEEGAFRLVHGLGGHGINMGRVNLEPRKYAGNSCHICRKLSRRWSFTRIK